MKKSLLATALLALVAIAGCTENATDDSESSSNDIVTGDPRKDTGASYGTQKGKDAPLPDLEGNGAEGSVTAKKLLKLPGSLNLKPALDIPKPPIETPSDEELTH